MLVPAAAFWLVSAAACWLWLLLRVGCGCGYVLVRDPAQQELISLACCAVDWRLSSRQAPPSSLHAPLLQTKSGL